MAPAPGEERLFVKAIGLEFQHGESPSVAIFAAWRGNDGAAVAEQCSVCHGKNGASTESSSPIIGGYSAKYIVESLKNFKKKVRTCAEVTIQSGPKKGSKPDMCKVVPT